MSFIQRFLLGNRVEDDLQVGLFLKNDGTVWLRNPDGSETQVSGGGGGSFPPPKWTVGTHGELEIDFTDDVDGDYTGLVLKAAAIVDSFDFVRFLDSVGDPIFKVDAIGGITARSVVASGGVNITDGFGTITLQMQGSPAGAVVDIESGAQILQSPIDNPNSYIMVVRSGGYTDGSVPVYDAWGLKPQGQEYLTGSVPTPDDADVLTGERWQWYDATAGAPKLLIKERDADGTLFSRISAVLVADASAFAGIAQPLLSATPTVAQISTVLAGLGLTRQT